jgi:hypothetical protein
MQQLLDVPADFEMFLNDAVFCLRRTTPREHEVVCLDFVVDAHLIAIASQLAEHGAAMLAERSCNLVDRIARQHAANDFALGARELFKGCAAHWMREWQYGGFHMQTL